MKAHENCYQGEQEIMSSAQTEGLLIACAKEPPQRKTKWIPSGMNEWANLQKNQYRLFSKLQL